MFVYLLLGHLLILVHRKYPSPVHLHVLFSCVCNQVEDHYETKQKKKPMFSRSDEGWGEMRMFFLDLECNNV